MDTNDLTGITLKEIFEKILGEENGRELLSKIQAKYDDGVRGKELEKYAKEELKNYTEILSIPIPIATVNVR